MNVTNAFFVWFYTGLNGLGGWFLFFLLAAAAVIWLYYDSSRRRLPALGWRTVVVIAALLLLPSIIFRFSGVDTQASLSQFIEAIFYLGLLGGVLPPVLAVGYFVTYQGMLGCPNGHVYEAALGQCPECARMQAAAAPAAVIPQAPAAPPVLVPMAPPPAGRPQPAPRPKAQAWLAGEDGRTYQVNLDETTIGRSSTNDIQLSGDATISRQHARIVEQNGHFRLVDLGSTAGTWVNDKMVRQPVLLEADDLIRFGDNTSLRFVTSHR